MKCAQKRTNVSYGNPIIADIETAKQFKRHREQLKNIRPAIDMRPPKAAPHLQLYGRDYFAKKKATTEAAFQDLKMIQSIAKTMTRAYVVPNTSGPVSLNSSYRKRELFRITMDNHRLLERLENIEPVFSTKKMDEEHQVRQKYMVNSSYSARKQGNYDGILKRGPGRPGESISKHHQSLPALPAIPDEDPLEETKSDGDRPAEVDRPNEEEDDYQEDDFEDDA